MKYLVEFGRIVPGIAPGRQPHTVPGLIFRSAKEAAKAARQIAFVLSGGVSDHEDFFRVTKANPRMTWYSAGQDAWVTVSIVTGYGGSGAETVYRSLKNAS
jgi:hypothetical protein